MAEKNERKLFNNRSLAVLLVNNSSVPDGDWHVVADTLRKEGCNHVQTHFFKEDVEGLRRILKLTEADAFFLIGGTEEQEMAMTEALGPFFDRSRVLPKGMFLKPGCKRSEVRERAAKMVKVFSKQSHR